MKKIIFILTILFSINLFAIENDTMTFNDVEKVDFEKKEVIVKVGTSYVFDAEKLGLNVAANYYYKLDPYFAFGGEVDFLWVKWDRTLGSTETGNTTGTLTSDTDAFTFPILLNGQVRLPNLVSKIYVEPSFTLGMGFTTMILNNSIAGNTNTDLYGGFVWQFISSVDFRPSENSKIKFVFDLGYMSTELERNNVKIDMSGMIVRAGVKFNL